MLTDERLARGFSLIELMVVLTLIGVLLALGVPAVTSWTGDARLHSVAESFTNGLRLAQATAVARNHVTVFAVTSDTPAYTANPVANGTNWMVVVDPLSATEATDANFLAQGLVQSSTEARQHAVSVNSHGNTMVCFNSFGQQTANLTNSLASATVTCATPGNDTSPTTFDLSRTGSLRAYRVLVYAGGRVRMCDVLKTLSTTNPDGCPPTSP